MSFEPIATPRLLLRRLELSDATTLQRLAGDPLIAATTLTIPHPYPDGAAEQFIALTQNDLEEERGLNLAIERREDHALLGVVSLAGYHPVHRRGEMGYWIGLPYWGRGYATEAAGALIRYGFEELNLNSVFARHFTTNPASGRVMQKLGMAHDGTLRQQYYKNDAFVDVAYYSLLRTEWEERTR